MQRTVILRFGNSSRVISDVDMRIAIVHYEDKGYDVTEIHVREEYTIVVMKKP